MNIHLIIISIIEGLTEFLPVSSTGHLIIAGKLMSVDLADSYTKFYLLFIQFGALLAGILLFSKKLLTNKRLFINVCISFVPTAIIGLILYKVFKSLLEGNMVLLALMLLAGGIILIYLEKIFMKKRVVAGDTQSSIIFGKDQISYMDAFIIGVAQAVAIIPGVSRSGATIVAGLFRGIKKAVIIEYTFILAIPTLGAATLYDIYKSKDVLASLHSYNELVFGFLISFFVALISLYFLKKYLPRISLTSFGWYRIIIAILVILYFR